VDIKDVRLVAFSLLINFFNLQSIHFSCKFGLLIFNFASELIDGYFLQFILKISAFVIFIITFVVSNLATLGIAQDAFDVVTQGIDLVFDGRI